MAMLDLWARNFDGVGHLWEEQVNRWFERVASLGLHGVRVFGETTDWGRSDHMFFNGDRATSDLMWDYDELRAGSRPRDLTTHNQVMLLKLHDLLQKHGLIAEYVIDATLKHTPGVGWDVIGHCIRQTMAFFREQEFSNILVELHNEWDAHSQGSWLASEYDRQGALGELNRQLNRVRRAEQWPDAVFGVSHGGRNDIEYDVVSDKQYVAYHPERQGDWHLTTNLGREYRGLNPVYYNESKHFIDPMDWDGTIGAGWFRPQSSTRDIGRYWRFFTESYDNGISFCFHHLQGMYSDASLPLNTLEHRIADAFGPGAPPLPTPPPALPMVDYSRIIEPAYQQILGRQPDPGGREHYNRRINEDMTEAEFREELLRSEEYEAKNG